jgi:hypothetical protein
VYARVDINLDFRHMRAPISGHCTLADILQLRYTTLQTLCSGWLSKCKIMLQMIR